MLKIRTGGSYNNNNLVEMAPISYDKKEDVLSIEKEQYDAWDTNDCLSLLYKHFPTIERVDKVERLPPGTPPDWYYKVYNTALSRANVSRWYYAVPGIHIIPLSAELQTILSDTDGLAYTDEANKLSTKIQSIMDNNSAPDGWFGKCGTCSSKHHYPPTPLFNGEEAVSHLLNALPVKRALYRNTADCIVLRPWDRKITDDNEVRVFTRNNTVTGVSQQACYDVVPIMNMLQPLDVIDAAQICYNKVREALIPIDRFDYECTFDAYITTDSDGNLSMHMIEINSDIFGWGPSGASLFNWIDDPPPSVTDTPVFYIMGKK